MMSTATQQPTAYLDRVNGLFTQIERWSRERDLTSSRYSIQLNEEAYGVYTAEGLRLSAADGTPLGALIPIGASIIGAKGRVDFEGTVDQAILVDWDVGGPVFESVIRAGEEEQTTRRPIYRGVDEAGWYWVESRQLARAHRLDERLFWDLLFLVSDYDLRG
ncbi:MAG: hypothetical protein V2I45_12140 [Halieaceae bacterium]|jgi:hypothetical protein|nr:hypothetical protein [Halieaceae bacterium]